jgi:hypothetical protein
MSSKLVQLTSDVISGTSVIIPVGIYTIGSIIGTFVTSIVATIIAMAPPAVTSRMPMNVTYLTCGVDIGGGMAVTTLTTIVITTTLIIIAVGTIIMIVLASTIILTATIILMATIVAIVLATMIEVAVVLAPAIILAWAVILTAVIIAWSFILARTMIFLSWASIILTRTSVTASRVCRRGEAGFVLLELTIELLNLTKKIIKCCTWIGIDSSAEIIVVLAEAMKNIVDKFIVVHRLAGTSELRSDALHLGEVLVSGEVVLACVVEG